MAFADSPAGTMLGGVWEPQTGGTNVRSCIALGACGHGFHACAGAARLRRRAQSGGARLQAAGSDQVESAERRRLAECGAHGRSGETGPLPRAQQMAERKPFQPPAFPSQRPLHHGPRRHLADGQRNDVRSRQQRAAARWHIRNPLRQASALGRRKRRRRVAPDFRRWTRN